MDEAWAKHGQGMGKAWPKYGQGMGKAWAKHGQSMGKAWARHGQVKTRQDRQPTIWNFSKLINRSRSQ